MSNHKRESIAEAGLIYIGFVQGGGHILKDPSTGKYELWQASKDYAGYALKYRNTHLEFCASADTIDELIGA